MVRKITKEELLQILKDMSDNDADFIEIFADSDADTMYIVITDNVGYEVER